MEFVKNADMYLPMIKKIVTFRLMSDEDLSWILSKSELLQFEEKEKIIVQGEVNQDFYAVLDGSVQVSVTEDNGTDVYICTIGAGEVFGEAGMFLHVKRTANVESLARTVIIRIPRQEMVSFIKNNPVGGNKFLLVIIHSLLRKLREANQELAYERQSDVEQDDIDAIVNDYLN